MNNEILCQDFLNHDIRVEQIFHIASQLGEFDRYNALREVFEDDWDSVWLAMGVESPDYEELREELRDYLFDKGKLGFLVQFATPLPKYYTKDAFTSTWGHYMTKWIYAETYEETLALGEEWALEFLESERVKQGAE